MRALTLLYAFLGGAAVGAKKFNLLIVPATSFGCPGYVRMAYCVSNEMIHRALPALQKLADHYGLKK